MKITNSIANEPLTVVSWNLTPLNEVDTKDRAKRQLIKPKSISLSPATSGLGIQTYIVSKPLARFCCQFLNLPQLAKSALSKSVTLIEAQTRQPHQASPMGARAVFGQLA